MKIISVVIFVLLSIKGVSATPYKGIGGQLEAYGTLTGAYYSALRSTEICSRFPGLSQRAMRIGKKYRADNDSLYYDKISKRITDLAFQNGGKVEQQRLLIEMQRTEDGNRKILDAKLSKLTSDEPSCIKLLDNIAAGLWDLQLAHGKEIIRIIGEDASQPEGKTYAGLRFGMTQDAVLKALSESRVTNRYRKHDNHSVSFDKTPVEVKGTQEGTAYFVKDKLYKITLKIDEMRDCSGVTGVTTGCGGSALDQMIMDKSPTDSKARHKEMGNAYASFKARLTSKYGQPTRVAEQGDGLHVIIKERVTEKFEELLSEAVWRDGDVVITLVHRRKWREGTLSLTYESTAIDSELANEKEVKDGL